MRFYPSLIEYEMEGKIVYIREASLLIFYFFTNKTNSLFILTIQVCTYVYVQNMYSK